MKKSLKTRVITLFLVIALCFFAVGCADKSEAGVGDDTSVGDPVLPDSPTDDVFPPEESTPPEVPEQSPPDLPDMPEEPVVPDQPEQEPSPVRKILIRTLVGLNIRSGPSATSKIVGVTDEGDCLPYLGSEGGFYLTVYKSKRAYVSNNVRYSTLISFEGATDRVENVINVAQELLGFPYVYGAQRLHYGGKNPVLNSSFIFGEFDCSSLVQYAFMKGAGLSLQVTTRYQYADGQGQRVSLGEIARGDLLYFTNDSRKNKTGIERIGHVAIYLGPALDESGKAIGDYILHTATDHAVIEPFSLKRRSFFEGGIRLI